MTSLRGLIKVETLSAIAKRTSVREFSGQPIPKEKIEAVVDAGRRAPTARGVEPWEFVAIQNKEMLSGLAQIIENARFIAQAACCIVVFCRETKYYLEDGCAATENMLLAATDLGLVSCWVAGDKKPYCPRIKSMLGAEDSLKLVSMIALGSPQQEKPAHKKRSLKEVLHWEDFSNTK